MKAPEFTEHHNRPLPFSHIHKQICIYQSKTLHIEGATGFLTDTFNPPFIPCHFPSAGGVWTQTDGPRLGRSCYMCWQHSCRTSLSWFHGTDVKAALCRAVQYTFDSLTHQQSCSEVFIRSEAKRCLIVLQKDADLRLPQTFPLQELGSI